MIDAPRGGDAEASAGDAAQAVAAVAALLGPRAKARGVALEAESAPGLAPAALGRDALRQVLLNLALNALDASPAGARVRIAAHPERGGVALSVSDEGPGLAPGGRARSRPGGLGLAITRRLVEGAGGALAFARGAAGGTLARVWLPAA